MIPDMTTVYGIDAAGNMMGYLCREPRAKHYCGRAGFEHLTAQDKEEAKVLLAARGAVRFVTLPEPIHALGTVIAW